MSTLGFNVATAVLSFIQKLQEGAEWIYDAKADPAVAGEHTTDGRKAIGYAVSIGHGRGSARMSLTGDQLAPVASTLRAFDPEADLSGLSPEECIRRTIVREKDGATTFKISLAPNSRTIKIPAGEWERFLDLMDANAASVDRAVEYYRDLAANTAAPETKTNDE